MSTFALPALSLFGFLVGMLLWIQFTRWVGLLYVSASKHGGDFLGPPKRRLLWATPVLALLYPAPWLIGMSALLGFRTFRSDSTGGWGWFFVGLSLALLFMVLSTIAVLVRWRHLRHSEKSRPNKSLERTREE